MGSVVLLVFVANALKSKKLKVIINKMLNKIIHILKFINNNLTLLSFICHLKKSPSCHTSTPPPPG